MLLDGYGRVLRPARPAELTGLHSSCCSAMPVLDG